jgi:methionyl-tRNA formyltransferase
MARLAELGAPVLGEAVKGLVDGSITPQTQPDEGVSYAPKITPEDARLDWTGSARQIDQAVRAFNPVPGAHTSFDGARLKVHRALPLDGEEAGEKPGTVLRADADGPVVACGSGLLRLDEVQPAGKPRMAGGAFVNGYRPVGHRLGDPA